MAEVVSLIASVITIAALVTDGVKRAKGLHQAPEELVEVQEQVEHFTNLINEIQGHHVDLLSPIVATYLTRAKLKFEQLDALIKTKILVTINGTSRARRRIWSRNKAKVAKIQGALKELRMNLLATMSANQVSLVARSEATSVTVNRRLSEIQQALSQTQYALKSQTTAIDCILHSVSCSCRIDCQCGAANQHQRYHELSLSYQRPTSPFESSPNYFPEMYTVDPSFPSSCLIVTKSFEQSICGAYKTNQYNLIYRRSPRHWCRLTASIKIHRSSRYWMATRTLRDEIYTKERGIFLRCAPLPYSLMRQVQTLLQSGDMHEDANFCCSLTAGDEIVKEKYNLPLRSLLTATRPTNKSLETLAFLDDLGCRKIFENEVTQIEMLDSTGRFSSCFHGRAVLERKFGSQVPDANLLYNIKVLHCMRDLTGYAKLVGVVVDSAGKYVKGYLIEPPRAQWKLDQVAGNTRSSWTTREKWAKSLILGVSQLHARGFVVGTLFSNQLPVVLDGSDAVQFYFFNQRFHVGDKAGAYYPPEFLHLRDSPLTTSEEDCSYMTTKTDIFHLGLILWLLAENVTRTNNSPVCIRERCNEKAAPPCDESHIDPIALPRLPESIPQYYRDIIDACRAKRLNERPTARSLLELFPQIREASPFKLESSVYQQNKMGFVGRSVLPDVNCDHCRKRYILGLCFHCGVCDMGDFDICQACYDAGVHCYEEDHLLVDMRKIGSWVVPGKYHSSVKDSGKRCIVEL